MNRYILMIICAAITSPSFAQPQIRVLGDTVCDFDTIYQGEKREAIFEIMNTGNQPLLVQNIESSCGCTAALMSADLIAPNATARLVANFDSKGLLGPMQKVVYVRTNDPVRPELQLGISGSVAQEIESDLYQLTFSHATAGKTTREKITLRNVVTRPIRLLRLISPYKSFRLHFREVVLMPNEAVALDAEFTPVEPGFFSGEVIIQTDSKRQNEISIRFSADVPWPDDFREKLKSP